MRGKVNHKLNGQVCISIAYIYKELGKNENFLNYMLKAKEIYELRGDEKEVEDINNKISEFSNEPEESYISNNY